MSKQKVRNFFPQLFDSPFPVRGQVDLPSPSVTEKEEQKEDDKAMTAKVSRATQSPEKADEFKIRGNDCVKAGQFQKAIHYYTEAIRLNKFEAIYFSNRALCNLKLKRFLECIEDCTIAIGLDERCAKAYYRRMQAREELNENLEAALSDCRKVLTIEPKDSAAHKSLTRLEALLNERRAAAAKATVEIQKVLRERAKNPLSAEVKAPWSQYEGRAGYKPIDFVSKPAHQQSHVALKTIQITEISAGSSSPSTANTANQVVATVTEQTTATNDDAKARKTFAPELSIPKTAAQFHKSWSSVSSSDQKYTILKGIYKQNVATLLGSQFDVNLLSDILSVLAEYFVPKSEPIVNVMRGIVSNREISIAALLMSDADKSAFARLLTYMRTNGEDNAAVDEIERKFKTLSGGQ